MNLWHAAVLATLLLGCDSSVCDLGATRACACAGGATGVQACAASGERWDTCDCGAVDAGPGTDAGTMRDAGTGSDAMAGDDASPGDAGTDAGRPDECMFVACGGDPAGMWATAAVCRRERTIPCDGVVYTGETYVWPQTLDIRTDGTYTWERMTLTWTQDYVVPSTCIDPGDMTCAQYASSGGVSIGVRTCTGDVAVECTCHWRANSLMPTTETGTWSRTRNLITFTDSTSASTRWQLCVTGDWLHLLLDGSPTPAGLAFLFERR